MQQEQTVRRGGFTRTQQSQQSRAELDAVMIQRSEMQSQLKQIAERRTQLFVQFQATPDATMRKQLDARMIELDERSARLDKQIADLNDRVVEMMGRVSQSGPVIVEVPNVPQIVFPPSARGRGGSLLPPQERGPDMREVAGIMAAEAVALVLLGVVAWRFGMKRMREQFSLMLSAQHSQMNQLQQSVDVIGVEVERISEAQRYVAKKLTEGAPVGASVGREAVASKRDG